MFSARSFCKVILQRLGLLNPARYAERSIRRSARGIKRVISKCWRGVKQAFRDVPRLKRTFRGNPRVERTLRAMGWLEWRSLVPEEQFSASCDLAIKLLHADGYTFGDYLEFGVSRGTSLVCMYHALHRAGLPDVRLIGFDSFKGLPREAAGQGWTPGDYASTIGATKRYLRKSGVPYGKVRLVKGWFSDTLTPKTVARLRLSKASLIMVDSDLYTACKEVLWFCEPLILDRSVIIFDNWGWIPNPGRVGEREAFVEFFKAFPHFRFHPLPAYMPRARMFLITRLESVPQFLDS